MKILSIALKELKHNFRNKQAMIMMIIFPLVLMLILGTALSKIMDGKSLEFEETRIIYSIKGNGELSKGFEVLTEEMKKFNMEFMEIEDSEKGINSIANNNFICYVEIDEAERKLKLYKNDRFDFEAGFVEGILGTFIQRYNVIYEIGKVNPKVLPDILENNQKNYNETSNRFVKVESVDKKRRPRAIDYYGITMLTLFIMYSMLTGANSIKSEKITKTEDRMAVSPVTRGEIFIGKTIGIFLVTILQMFIVTVFSTKVIGVYWGVNIGTILLIIAAEIIMCLSLGIGIGLLIKDEGAMNGVLNVIIPIMVFLGGGYLPLEQFDNAFLLKIAKLSPVNWVNNSLFNVIYRNNFDDVFTTILINIIIAVLFFIISSMKFTRKETV